MHKPNTETTSFVESLYQKASAYFASQPNSRFATSFGMAKSIFLILLYIGCYCYFVFGNHDFSTLLLSAGLLGIGHVLLPVNVGHDAIHGTLSSRGWINQLGLYSIELTGASSYMYSRKHLEAHRNKEHGSKVNAIEAQGLLLQKAKKDKVVNLPYLFYLLYAEYMIVVRDFQLFYSEARSIPSRAWVTLFVSKLAYVFTFLLLPFLFIPLPAWQIACSLLLMYFIITVLLVIILLMPTEKMENAKLTMNNQVNEQWAFEILAHNVDFSPGSRVLNNLAGGANLNVVHYFFPNTHHVHYNKLASLVEETAKEQGVCYRKQNVRDVIGIHFSYIRKIQQQEDPLTTTVQSNSL